MKSEKHKELLLEMIVSLSNIDSLDLNLGDSNSSIRLSNSSTGTSNLVRSNLLYKSSKIL